MPLTNAQNQALYRARKKKEGWKTLHGVYPPCVFAKVAQYARECMAEYKNDKNKSWHLLSK